MVECLIRNLRLAFFLILVVWVLASGMMETIKALREDATGSTRVVIVGD
jgi:hypothetical protein